MPQARATVFIGSSSEQASIARCLAELLHSGADVHPWWNADSFKPNSSTLDSLFRAANKYDFGVFIFTSDDYLVSRKKKFFSARDNVIFEFGLFLGAMGADRTFGLMADSFHRPVKVPTDLLGIQLERFTYSSEDNLRSSIGTVSTKFERQIRRAGPRQRKLIDSWEFHCETQEFAVALAQDKMALHADKIDGRELILVFRKDNPELHPDDDHAIGLSSLRRADPNERHVMLVARRPKEFDQINRGESAQGYLFLSPAGEGEEIARLNRTKLAKSKCMRDIKAAGFQLLEGPVAISD